MHNQIVSNETELHLKVRPTWFYHRLYKSAVSYLSHFVSYSLVSHQLFCIISIYLVSYDTSVCILKFFHSHLSPGVSLISDHAHDSGILQSELFTSRSQNLVLAKLPNSGFWRYSQIFKWNRVKMAKNGLKMVEIF